MIKLFELPPRFLDGEGVGRIAHLDVGLFPQGLHVNLLAADKLHLLQQGSLQQIENHDPAAGHLLRISFHVDEQVRVIEPADVFGEQVQVEGSADSGANVRQNLVQRQGLIALNPHVDHDFLLPGGGSCARRWPGRLAPDGWRAGPPGGMDGLAEGSVGLAEGGMAGGGPGGICCPVAAAAAAKATSSTSTASSQCAPVAHGHPMAIGGRSVATASAGIGSGIGHPRPFPF